MASISSLLKSASSIRDKIRTQQDALTAFQWESSAQTYDDFLAYSNYLEDRSSKTTDPSSMLTYQTKLRSARRSFTSNEIQRSQISIMEGRGDTQSKMNAVQNLYYQAVDNQDFNLAQNLISQWDTLSIKQQNEREAAIKSYQAAGDKSFQKLTDSLTKGVDDVTLPNGVKVTPLSQIARDLEQTGGSNVTWKAAGDTLEALRGAIIDRYKNATTQDEVTKLEEKYGAGLQDLDKELGFTVGGKKLSAQDVVNAAANEEINNPIYSLKAIRNEVTGKNEFKLQENNIATQDYVRQVDANGQEYYVPATVRTDQNGLFFGQSDQGRGLKTQITDQGEVIGGGTKTGQINLGTSEVQRNESQTIENRLKELGIVARQNGTTLSIKLPGESVERQATVQPDGSIRYYDDQGKLIEFGLVDRNLGTSGMPLLVPKGQVREVSPEEVSDFGKASAFGGMLSQSSAQGNRYVNDILGNVRPSPIGNLAGPIRTGNDFRGYGTAVTSDLLQSAATTRQQIAEQQAKQAMIQAQADATARLQATPTFNLNQTPIQQLTSSGVMKRQLQVAAPTPQPRVYVAPAPTQTISGVGVARPGTVSGVGVSSGSTRKVTVR